MITLLCCERFLTDISHIVDSKYHEHIVWKTYPCSCKKNGFKTTPDIYKIVDILICGEKCKILKEIEVKEKLVLNDYCNVHTLDESFMSYILENGGYVVSSDSLINWKKDLDAQGFDEQTSKLFYNEICKEIVYIDNGAIQAPKTLLIAYSKYVSKPYKLIKYSNVLFKNLLNEKLSAFLLKRKNKSIEVVLSDLRRKYSESNMILSFTYDVFKANTLDETIAKFKQLFLSLFGARTVNYYQLSKQGANIPDRIMRAYDSNENIYIDQEMHEIYVKLENDTEVFGILEIKDFILHSLINRYKSTLLLLSSTLSIALILQHQKNYELVIQLNKNLEIQNEQMLLQVKNRENFFSNIVHEIRTPMNSMIGMIQLLNMTELTQEQLNYTKTSLKSAAILRELTNDFLDFSKIKNGMFVLNEKKIKINELLSDIELTMKPLFDEKLNQLIVSSTSFPNIIGDDFRIKQVLINLLSNANKFTNQGHIYLKVSYETVNANEIELTFVVSDEGVGMKKNDLDRIFIDYEQIQRKVNHKSSGTGLGLPITKKLVELMNGSILVDSELNQGTTFTVKILCHKTKSKKDNHAHKNSKLLLVEDDELSLLILTKICEKQNWDYRLARNGNDAVKLIQDEHFDLVLMDYHMPGLTGVEVLKSIRGRFDRYVLPVLAMSGDSKDNYVEQFMDAGANGFILKPINIKTLIDDINTLIKTIP